MSKHTIQLVFLSLSTDTKLQRALLFYLYYCKLYFFMHIFLYNFSLKLLMMSTIHLFITAVPCSVLGMQPIIKFLLHFKKINFACHTDDFVAVSTVYN